VAPGTRLANIVATTAGYVSDVLAKRFWIRLVEALQRVVPNISQNGHCNSTVATLNDEHTDTEGGTNLGCYVCTNATKI
jgi:hypothetical protein